MLDVSLPRNWRIHIRFPRFLVTIMLVFWLHHQVLISSIKQSNSDKQWVQFVKGRGARERSLIRLWETFPRPYCTSVWLSWAILINIQCPSYICLAVPDVRPCRPGCSRHRYWRLIGRQCKKGQESKSISGVLMLLWGRLSRYSSIILLIDCEWQQLSDLLNRSAMRANLGMDQQKAL